MIFVRILCQNKVTKIKNVSFFLVRMGMNFQLYIYFFHPPYSLLTRFPIKKTPHVFTKALCQNRVVKTTE